jgi:hypothetical protein
MRTARAGQRESSYLSLAREVRKQILQGRYAEGRQLPTEAEFSAQYQVSRQTVRRAFQDLVAEGMVYRVPGRGTFAAARDGGYVRQFGSVDDLMGLSADTQMDVIAPLRRQVDVNAAGRLRLPADIVYTLSFRRSHHGAPFCLTVVSLRASPSRWPTPGQPGRSAAPPGTRCCVSTGCTWTPAAPRSSSRSAISCPSFTPTASSCAAASPEGLPPVRPRCPSGCWSQGAPAQRAAGRAGENSTSPTRLAVIIAFRLESSVLCRVAVRWRVESKPAFSASPASMAARIFV